MYKIAFENPRICLECTVNVLVLVKVIFFYHGNFSFNFCRMRKFYTISVSVPFTVIYKWSVQNIVEYVEGTITYLHTGIPRNVIVVIFFVFFRFLISTVNRAFPTGEDNTKNVAVCFFIFAYFVLWKGLTAWWVFPVCNTTTVAYQRYFISGGRSKNVFKNSYFSEFH